MILPLLAVLAACAAPAPAPQAPPEPAPAPGVVLAGLGETARLGDVTVRPIAVLKDSRCPQDVECVWAGRLRLSAVISGMAGISELTLGQRFALPGGGAILLVTGRPEPWQTPPPGTNPNAPPRFGFRREP
jgi:hypothetical protein